MAPPHRKTYRKVAMLLISCGSVVAVIGLVPESGRGDVAERALATISGIAGFVLGVNAAEYLKEPREPS